MPPDAFARPPHVTCVPASTKLYRVHRSAHAPETFNPTPSHRYYGGGRFDSTADDVYAYSYLGSTPEVALSETLLRDLPVHHDGHRILQRAAVEDRFLSEVVLSEDVEIISFESGKGLGAVCQDLWLTTAPPRDYAQTRHWGHWIRSNAPSARGFQWRSAREPSGIALILFADTSTPGTLAPGEPREANWVLDSDQGRAWVSGVLAEYGVVLDD